MEVPHVAGMGAKPPEELRRCGGKEQQRIGVRNFRKEILNKAEFVPACVMYFDFVSNCDN